MRRCKPAVLPRAAWRYLFNSWQRMPVLRKTLISSSNFNFYRSDSRAARDATGAHRRGQEHMSGRQRFGRHRTLHVGGRAEFPDRLGVLVRRIQRRADQARHHRIDADSLDTQLAGNGGAGWSVTPAWTSCFLVSAPRAFSEFAASLLSRRCGMLRGLSTTRWMPFSGDQSDGGVCREYRLTNQTFQSTAAAFL